MPDEDPYDLSELTVPVGNKDGTITLALLVSELRGKRAYPDATLKSRPDDGPRLSPKDLLTAKLLASYHRESWIAELLGESKAATSQRKAEKLSAGLLRRLLAEIERRAEAECQWEERLRLAEAKRTEQFKRGVEVGPLPPDLSWEGWEAATNVGEEPGDREAFALLMQIRERVGKEEWRRMFAEASFYNTGELPRCPTCKADTWQNPMTPPNAVLPICSPWCPDCGGTCVMQFDWTPHKFSRKPATAAMLEDLRRWYPGEVIEPGSVRRCDWADFKRIRAVREQMAADRAENEVPPPPSPQQADELKELWTAQEPILMRMAGKRASLVCDPKADYSGYWELQQNLFVAGLERVVEYGATILEKEFPVAYLKEVWQSGAEEFLRAEARRGKYVELYGLTPEDPEQKKSRP